METLGDCDRPWSDLHDPLLESILERLPISDYIRFSAVCRRWRSIRTSHRRRHSPYPPAMLRLPWLIPSKPHQETLVFYSPFQDQFFSLHAPSSSSLCVHSIAHGWILGFISDKFTLWNPISGDKIVLPQWTHRNSIKSSGFASISPPPHYIVCIVYSSTIFLLRWFDSSWVTCKLHSRVKCPIKTVSFGGKHYRICSERKCRDRELSSYDLLVVDALARPATCQYFEMMGGDKMPEETRCRHWSTHLVELNEELLLVKEIVRYENNHRGDTVGFEVFRANLGRQMWVKVESLGDKVIMLHRFQSVSMLAADIGARGNCIYFSTGLRFREDCAKAPWKVFDLGTGMLTDLLLPNASQIEENSQLLFVPSLC